MLNDRNIKKIALWQMTSAIVVVIGSLVLAGGIFTASMFVSYATFDGNLGYKYELLDELGVKSMVLIFGSFPIIGAGIIIPMWRVWCIKEESS